MTVNNADVLRIFNVSDTGRGTTPLMFAHGFGCDQVMWDAIGPAFADDYRVISFDYIGAGGSDAVAYDPLRHSSLAGYAADVNEICDALALEDVIFVGHSVSAMIGVLAAIQRPDRFAKLILVCPSPCYLDDGDYRGGFDKAALTELLQFMDSNFLGWSSTMAPVIMGNADRPQLSKRLAESFCRAEPTIAKQFAQVTFFSDNRADLEKCRTAALILQCSDDVIAPAFVGAYVHRHLSGSRLVHLEASGHCPHVSSPAEVIAAMKEDMAAPEFGGC